MLRLLKHKRGNLILRFKLCFKRCFDVEASTSRLRLRGFDFEASTSMPRRRRFDVNASTLMLRLLKHKRGNLILRFKLCFKRCLDVEASTSMLFDVISNYSF